MTKTSLADIPGKLYAILEPLNAEDRAKAVRATLVLFGDEIPNEPSLRTPPSGGTNATVTDYGDVAEFFNQKDPKNKGEVLAVAARYREINEQQESHSKSDLKKVVTDSHRNFDDSNFGRDINNAKRQAGFFVLGGDRDAHKLSYYGKQYVDALPDREAAGELKRPRVGGGGKKSRKKAAKKAKSAN